MPDNVVKGLAKKSGKSISSVENAWESSTQDYIKQNNVNKSDLSDKDWAIIVSITKNKIGMKESLEQRFLESNLSAKEFFEAENPDSIEVENPGMLEVPDGKNVEDLGEDHFKSLIKKKGWDPISKALMNLARWNSSKNKSLASWADSMQSKLSKWVDSERESNSDFAK